MNRAIRNTCSTALLVGTLSGCGIFEKDSFDPSAREALQSAYDQNQKFWQKHVGAVANTRLVLLEGDNTFICESTVVESTDDTASYCSDSDVIVVPAQAAQIDKDFGATTKVMAHEFGHAVQNNDRRLLESAPEQGLAKFKELQATCLAGVFAESALEANEVPLLYTSFQAGETSDAHGTGAEQAAAFDAGVTAVSQGNDYLKACATL